MFGNMDPYVLLDFGDQQQRTQVQDGKGKNPIWEQKFSFRANVGDVLKLRVMDENGVGDDDEVMHSEIMVKMTNGAREDLQLTGYYKEKNAGELMITIKYLKDGEEVEDDFEKFYA